jgi:hypothetical protein
MPQKAGGMRVLGPSCGGSSKLEHVKRSIKSQRNLWRPIFLLLIAFRALAPASVEVNHQPGFARSIGMGVDMARIPSSPLVRANGRFSTITNFAFTTKSLFLRGGGAADQTNTTEATHGGNSTTDNQNDAGEFQTVEEKFAALEQKNITEDLSVNVTIRAFHTLNNARPPNVVNKDAS